MRKLAWLAATLTAAVGIGACSMLGHQAFQQPVVTLRDVRLAGVGITGGSLDVILNVYNPNHFRLDATHMNYKVALDGDSITLASGSLDNHFSVNEGDTSHVTIPVNFTYTGVGAAGRSIMSMGTVNYHVTGDVTVGTVVGSHVIPFSQTGRFTTTGIRR